MPRGLLVWLTDLSGFGKITIVRTVEDVLKGISVVENSFLQYFRMKMDSYRPISMTLLLQGQKVST